MPISLENISLVLLRDSQTAPMWLDRWAYSYPTAHLHALNLFRQPETERNQCHAHANHLPDLTQWQQQIQHTIDQVPSEDNIMLVAHGAAANATAAWYYQSNTAHQKRIIAIILVAPHQQHIFDDANHTFQRVRFNCPTAFVVSQNDPQSPQKWAQQQAQTWQARCLISPHTGHLDTALDGWQWGMKLMQEMLLNQTH